MLRIVRKSSTTMIEIAVAEKHGILAAQERV
jgi:hypothetical protein